MRVGLSALSSRGDRGLSSAIARRFLRRCRLALDLIEIAIQAQGRHQLAYLGVNE